MNHSSFAPRTIYFGLLAISSRHRLALSPYVVPLASGKYRWCLGFGLMLPFPDRYILKLRRSNFELEQLGHAMQPIIITKNFLLYLHF